MHTSDPRCEFCAIANGEAPHSRVVYQDNSAVAFFPKKPASLGHTLLIPRTHVAEVTELQDEIAARLGILTVALAKAIDNARRPEGLSIIQSNGLVASQTVMHLHIHLVPRWGGDALRDIWPECDPTFTDAELDAACVDVTSATRIMWGN